MVRRWSSATSEYEAEASGSSASEQVKSRLLKAVVFNFNQLDLDPHESKHVITLQGTEYKRICLFHAEHSGVFFLAPRI